MNIFGVRKLRFSYEYFLRFENYLGFANENFWSWKIFGVGNFLRFAYENVPRFPKSGMSYPSKNFSRLRLKQFRRLVMKMFAVGKFLGCKNIRGLPIKMFAVGKCFGVCKRKYWELFEIWRFLPFARFERLGEHENIYKKSINV